jgi:hypothetical protein
MPKRVIARRSVTDEFDTIIIVAGAGLTIVSVESGGNAATRIGDTYVTTGQYRDSDAVAAAVQAELT